MADQVDLGKLPGVTEDINMEAIEDEHQRKDLLDNRDVLADLGYFLKGYYFDPTKKNEDGTYGAYIKQKGAAQISEAAYPVFMNEMHMRLSKVFSTSNLKPEEIAARSRAFTKAFGREIWLRREEFGIKPVSFPRLLNVIDDACYNTAKKAQSAILLRSLQKNHRVIETRALSGTKSGGGLGIFNK